MPAPDEQDDAIAPLARPFLGRQLDPLASNEGRIDPTDIGVRPYFITGGRTRSREASVSFETVVVATELDTPMADRLARESRSILHLAKDPQSVAELSARLRLPIGVVCVLCGDLSLYGLLRVHEAPENVADDIEILNLLIDVLRKL